MRRSRPCSTGALGGGLGDRLLGGIAQAQQDLLSAPGTGAAQLFESLVKCGQPEIGVALGPVESIQEGGNINQFCARFHEIEIKQLLAVHSIPLLYRCPRWPPSSAEIAVVKQLASSH